MRVSLLACLLVAACATPSPRFIGQTPLRFMTDGHGFALYRIGAEAEIIRTSRVEPSDIPRIAPLAVHGTETVTGCKVAWHRGDSAVLQMGLSCGGHPAPPAPRSPLELDCEATEVYTRPETGLSDIALECWVP